MQLTREQSRRIDTIAMEQYGISGLVLMENAGRGVAEFLKKQATNETLGPITICCGKGNNGGDGFVIARQLLTDSVETRIWLFADPESLSPDAAINYRILEKMKIPVQRFQPDLSASFESDLARSEWIIDALLGTGAKGPPQYPISSAIEAMNRRKKESGVKILAVDLPSGLDADTGHPSSQTVNADETCTLVAAKLGFLVEEAFERLGAVHVLPIGIPARIIEEILRNDRI